MITIEDIIDESWVYMKRTGMKPQSVAMNVDHYRHVMRLKDGDGTYCMHRLDDGTHSLLGVPVVIDDSMAGVKFSGEAAGTWICAYCGATLHNGNAQCAQCGGWK